MMDDRIGDQPLTPETVDLSTLRGFLEEVEKLIKGDFPDASLADSRVRIEAGSLKVVTMVSTVLAINLRQDIRTLAATADLDAIQAKRAQIVETWQTRAHRSPSRIYTLDSVESESPIRITPTSRFIHGSERAWVSVEKYLSGKVVDLGGKQDPRIHLVVGETNESIRIGATEKQLTSERENQIYRQVTVRVLGEQHLRTKKLRNLHLVEMLTRQTEAEEDRLAGLWQKGQVAWKDIGSASEWVDKLRGNS